VAAIVAVGAVVVEDEVAAGSPLDHVEDHVWFED
jgi:hypothetical protein